METLTLDCLADSPQWARLERMIQIGAHIVTGRDGYMHHGIYAGHGQVIHYGGFDASARRRPVEVVPLRRFAAGRGVSVRNEPDARYAGAQVVERAKSRLGEDRYQLLTNNCEHFCTWCVRGVARSEQVCRCLRNPWKGIRTLYALARAQVGAMRERARVEPPHHQGACAVRNGQRSVAPLNGMLACLVALCHLGVSALLGHGAQWMPACRAGILAVTCMLAGCASMKGLETQAVMDDANQLGASASLAATPVSPAAWPRQAWWEDFGDPQLSGLVRTALAGQPTLRVAAARVRQADALAGGAEASLYPQANLLARTTRQRYSENGPVSRPLAGSWKWSSDVMLGLGYELDFWGRNQATFDAALDRARAVEVDYHAAELMLTTSVVRTYLKLDAAHAQLELAEQTYRQRQNTLDLTRRRVEAQLDSRLDMKQAEAALPATRERIAAIRELIALTRNQLAALAGKGPDAGAGIGRPRLRSGYAVAVPAALPAELIGRRPDVVAQRWRVEASRHDIKAAKAQFYPNISITAFAGLQSLSLSDLLGAGSRTLGIGPAITLPIFDGGRLRANLGARQAEYDGAVEQYNATLVTALHDVVNQLVSLHWLGERAGEQRQALQLTEQAYDMAVARYREGIGNYLRVLSAEGQVLQQRQLLIEIETQERVLHLELVRALGGGFGEAGTTAANATTVTSATPDTAPARR